MTFYGQFKANPLDITNQSAAGPGLGWGQAVQPARLPDVSLPRGGFDIGPGPAASMTVLGRVLFGPRFQRTNGCFNATIVPWPVRR